MDRFDSETVRNIWQRVQAGNGSTLSPETEKHPRCDLSQWIARELSTAALYMQLSKRLSGNAAHTLRRLARQEMSHATTLKGICLVCQGIQPQVRPDPGQKAPVLTLLQRCYGQKLQIVSAYEKRCEDPQYGSVFQKMLQEERDQCRILLQLMGNLSQPHRKTNPPRR